MTDIIPFDAGGDPNDNLLRRVSDKLAEMDGVMNLGIVTPSFEKYLEYNRKAIAVIQVITDADWLRFYAPGHKVSSPGF